jgi:hypothetical protein
MNWKMGASAIAVATLLAGSANAAIVTSITSKPFDNTIGTATFTFDDASPLSNSAGTFSGGDVRQGSQSDSATPFGDMTHYLSILGGTTQTLTPTVGFTEMQIYIGSIDDYNSFTFTTAGGSETLTGTELLADGVPSITPAAGNQQNGDNNRWFDIKFSAPVTLVTFGSKSNSLEFDNVKLLSGVPEPGVWAMMMTGFGLLGMALRSSKLATRFASL